MKRYIAFAIILSICTVLNVFLIEKTDFFNINETTSLEVTFSEEDGHITARWDKLPYPCIYKVETFSKTTGRVEGEPTYHKFLEEYTSSSEYALPSSAIPMYYQVTAYGIFGKLASPFDVIPNPNYTNPPAPVTIVHYTAENPASVKPYLVWRSVPRAVIYEVEILSAPPEKEGGVELSEKNHLFSTRRVYTNGYQADLSEYASRGTLYYRVRALDLDRKPIGVFSHSEAITIDKSLTPPDYPLINTFDKMPGTETPLYPVYQWIPMHDERLYEVELMIEPPSDVSATEPSKNREWYHTADDSFSCYDEYPRPYAGTYYWRVRAIDKSGKTIGRYSDIAVFTVPERKGGVFAAAFGDSITHGGGALSYSPFNAEYSYTTYLDFPALNLGRSGDTAHTTAMRFEDDVLPFHPRNLIIMTGSNDLRSYLTADDIIKDITTIREKCLANDIRPIFLTLMPINPANIEKAFHTPSDPDWMTKMKKINAFIREQEYYIDLEPYFYNKSHTLLNGDLSIDGLHPDIVGKMLMAEIINMNKDKFRK
ncbi:MAG: GDSL-type esterase/lipase family protein [Selenomonadaceae bacterium]